MLKQKNLFIIGRVNQVALEAKHILNSSLTRVKQQRRYTFYSNAFCYWAMEFLAHCNWLHPLSLGAMLLYHIDSYYVAIVIKKLRFLGMQPNYCRFLCNPFFSTLVTETVTRWRRKEDLFGFHRFERVIFPFTEEMNKKKNTRSHKSRKVLMRNELGLSVSLR